MSSLFIVIIRSLEISFLVCMVLIAVSLSHSLSLTLSRTHTHTLAFSTGLSDIVKSIS